jgi:hypothetical protein
MNITLFIPKKVSTNKIYSGMHWRERQHLADLYHYSFLPFKKLEPIKKFPIQLHFSFTMKRLLDASNCSFMAKMCEDSLVRIGILPDDTPKYVSSVHLYVTKGEDDTVNIYTK